MMYVPYTSFAYQNHIKYVCKTITQDMMINSSSITFQFTLILYFNMKHKEEEIQGLNFIGV